MTRSTQKRSLIAALAGLAIATTALAQQMGSTADVPMATQELADGRAERPTVGQRIDNGQLHRINRPGLYGISQSPTGSSYGVLDGRLIRYDPDTMRVQSIIRDVDQILD